MKTSNQIKADAKRITKEIPDADGKHKQGEVQQGSFSFVAPDVKLIQFNGLLMKKVFNPQGAHLPTTPPTPAASAKNLNNFFIINNELNPQFKINFFLIFSNINFELLLYLFFFLKKKKIMLQREFFI
ncbi:hypothetical protein PVAND_016455 [Polypedilum vanderplanki]|uniref:Uncharacterized protein n=1 Tax=Polypedilum vanderplanki TaxID=319348 RepID=A0A9J6BF67_POLVA|nr:hypothetical protein PVAND_016455 [Polypedilum vanderplanki]